jgi:hypothetical protein
MAASISVHRVSVVLLCLLGVAIACAPGEAGCVGVDQSATVDDLPAQPVNIDENARAQAADLNQSIDDWSQDVVNAVLEGTGVAAGANTEGDVSALAGDWTIKLEDEETGSAEQAQVGFAENGAAVELQLFAEDLSESATLAFPAPSPNQRVIVGGRLLGSIVRRLEDGMFDVTLVGVLDTQNDGAVVRTREVFQFLVTIAADGSRLLGVGRRTSEVIASADPQQQAGQILTTAGTTELVRNSPPIADAGPDLRITDSDGDGKELVQLEGGASTDSDGQISEFTWFIDDIQVASGQSPQTELNLGEFDVVLRVVDDRQAAATDTVTVIVEPPLSNPNSGVTFSAPFAIDSALAENDGPGIVDEEVDLASDGAGTWVAAWKSDIAVDSDLEVLVSVSQDNGLTWSSATPLNSNSASDIGGDAQPSLASMGASVWLALWVSDDDLGGTIRLDADVFFAQSFDGGSSWTAPKALNTNAGTDVGTDLRPDVTCDEIGACVAVWEMSGDDLGGAIGLDQDILSSVSTGGAVWSDPVPVSSEAGVDICDDRRPRIANDGAGTWIAVWDQSQDLGDGTCGVNGDILTATSIDNGDTWEDVTRITLDTLDDMADDRMPHIATDTEGRWIVVWESSDELGGSIGADRDILYSISDDDGATWTPAAILDSLAASDTANDITPTIETDTLGRWMAVWNSAEPGVGSNLIFLTSTDNGDSWSPQDADASIAGTDPALTTDGQGNWIAGWESGLDLDGKLGSDSDVLVTQITFR